jgi:hypothetical protein
VAEIDSYFSCSVLAYVWGRYWSDAHGYYELEVKYGLEEVMKFNIFFDIKGPAEIQKGVPNNTNPVECANLASLLSMVCKNLPANYYLNIETVGIRVEAINEDNIQGSD